MLRLYIAEIPKRKPSPDELNNLSQCIAFDWESLARRLSVSVNKINQIQRDNIGRSREQAQQALNIWMEKESNSASVEILCRALCQEKKKSVAATVFNLDDDILDRVDDDDILNRVDDDDILNRVDDDDILNRVDDAKPSSSEQSHWCSFL